MKSLAQVPSFTLSGKTALVTGAGRGIGAALATGIAAAGAHVFLAARSTREITELADAIKLRGDKATALVLDVSDLNAVKNTIAKAPVFDILVNNAGTNRPKPMSDVMEEDYEAVLGLNLKSAYFVTQAVVRRLIASDTPGSVIMISSQMGHVGAANRALYCASKHGMEGLTKALAIELAPKGIRVNSIAPTFIETPMTKPYFEDSAFRADVLSKIKLGRIGEPEDLLGAVLLLASEASSLITGTSIKIDGGWTAE